MISVLQRAAAKIVPAILGRPMILLHRVTMRCNCRCDFCDWWQNKEYDPARELTLEELKRIYREASGLGIRDYAIWGGEPLLRPDFDGVLRESKAAGIYSLTCTNGILLEERARELAPHMGYCILSIDGIGETHDQGRRHPGAFAKALRGIEALRRTSTPPRVRFWSQVNRQTAGSLEEVACLARDLGVELEYIPTWCIEGYNDKLMMPREEVRDAWERIRVMKQLGFPICNAESTIRMIRDGRPYKCHSPRRVISLDWDGRVQPCSRWLNPHYTWFPGLREGHIIDLITDPRFKQAAADLVDCNQCHSVCAMINRDTMLFTRGELFLEAIANGFRKNVLRRS